MASTVPLMAKTQNRRRRRTGNRALCAVRMVLGAWRLALSPSSVSDGVSSQSRNAQNKPARPRYFQNAAQLAA